MAKHGDMDLFEFIDRNPVMDEALTSHIFNQIVQGNYFFQLIILNLLLLISYITLKGGLVYQLFNFSDKLPECATLPMTN